MSDEASTSGVGTALARNQPASGSKVEHPGFESQKYDLDTLENCRALLSDCLKAVTDGEMPLDMGRFAADVAKKAADTLIKSGNTNNEVAGILRELARKQPAETGRGLGVKITDEGVVMQ